MVSAGGGGLDWGFRGVRGCLSTLRLSSGRQPSFVCFAATFPPGEGSAYAVQTCDAVLCMTNGTAQSLPLGGRWLRSRRMRATYRN